MVSGATFLMSSLAIFVVGPAGTGKTTFCHKMYEYLQNIQKEVYYVNFDPSSSSKIPYAFDITDIFSTEEVMKECEMGPNGGLIECFRGLVDIMDELDIFEFPNGSIVLIDCPGQIELYMHYDYIKTIMEEYQRLNYLCSVAYIIESHYLNDEFKFISACVSCLCTYSLFSIPQINVISKLDVLDTKFESYEQEEENVVEKYYSKFEDLLDIGRLKEKVMEGESKVPRRHTRLTLRLLDLLEDLAITDFVPFNAFSSELCDHVYYKICEATHFGEDDEVSSVGELDQGYYSE